MKKSILLFALLFVELLSAQGVEWHTMEQLSELEKNYKPIYIFIYRDNEPFCKRFEEQTLADEKAYEILNDNFYCVKFSPISDSRKYTFDGIAYDPLELFKYLSGEDLKSYPSHIFVSYDLADPNLMTGYYSATDFYIEVVTDGYIRDNP